MLRESDLGWRGAGTLKNVLKCLVIAASLVICGPAEAQSTFGSILGTVKDASGNIVTGATIALRNTGTGFERSANTDESGAYSFLSVEPGTYALTMQMGGFQKAEYPNLDLQARAQVIELLQRTATGDNCVVVACHDRELLELPGAKRWHLAGGRIEG